jgi:hypothetical protein
MRGNKTRFGVVSLLVMASVLGGIAFAEPVSAQDLTITETTTTKGDSLTNGKLAKGQGMNVTVDYSGIPASPSSPQTIKIVDNDPGGPGTPFVGDQFNELGTSFTITESDDTETVTVEYDDIGPNPEFSTPTQAADVQAKWRSGGETKAGSNAVNIAEAPTTMYIENVPSSVGEGETATVEFYGWSEENSIFPKLFTAGGNPIDTFGSVSPNPSFSGTVTFKPSDYTSVGTELDIQLHNQDEEGPKSNVKSIFVEDSGPDFDVSIDSTNSPVSEGETLSVAATVTNAGTEPDQQSISLEIGAPLIPMPDFTNVQLDPGESKTVTLTWDTDSGDAGDYTAAVISNDDTDSVDVTVQDNQDLFTEPLIGGFSNPPQNTGEIDSTLYEDLSGDGDGTSIDQTVDVFGELIRGNDLNGDGPNGGLTDEQARALNWDPASPETEVTVADMVELFGDQIRR